MAKTKSQYVCQQCGFLSAKWFGRCPECQSWDGLVEELSFQNNPGTSSRKTYHTEEPTSLDVVEERSAPFLPLPFPEMQRVLGKGLVKGSITLLGGDPGIGKSTLLLQLLGKLHESKTTPTLYVSGEESSQQLKLRAARLNIRGDSVFVYSETNLTLVLQQIERLKPKVVVIDSVQTIYCPELSSIPGSVSQVREVADQLVRIGKQSDIPIFIVGHVTKDGSIAGPKTLEHLVDTVLQFEGEREQSYRILRCLKNRFGPTDEIGVFEMKEHGLDEVENPSELFLRERPANAPGSVIFPAMEGSRPLLVEVQGLVCRSSYGVPMRNTVGFDKNRLTMLLAVLEKRAGIEFSTLDVYVNVVGGLKITEPAADMAVAAAVVSSFFNQSLSASAIVFGEMGLSGEIRSVLQQELRLKESKKLGFDLAFVPKSKTMENQNDMQLQVIATVSELLQKIR